MRRAAEIAAQVFTARDALLRDTPEDLRVAFLLFDSAVETLLVRRTQHDVNEWRFDMWPVMEEYGVPVVSVDLHDFGQRVREQEDKGAAVLLRLSSTQKKDIARDFDTKLRLLVWLGTIPADYIPVLSRLHAYRNELYHREESRPKTLQTVTHLYAWLVADLLERLPPAWVAHSSADPDDLPTRIYERIGIPVPQGEVTSAGRGLQALMATALRDGLRLDGVPALLADYVESRMEDLHQRLTYIGEMFAKPSDEKPLTPMQIIRLLYAEEWPEDLRQAPARGVPVTKAKLDEWCTWHARIREFTDPVGAFHSLAQFETEFEPVERKVIDMVIDIDTFIQRQIDIMRGK
ncbi:hypothetical protein ACIQTT_10565 [Microbacterium sp. NPDC090225]|uniref:hypothetical protein n=1 Tax=Microbacterium sp. NPDC090225 TaxID=3364207 RepID=UPI0038270450